MNPTLRRRVLLPLVLLAPLLLSSCFTLMVWGFTPEDEPGPSGDTVMVYDPKTQWSWDRVGCRVLLTPPALALDVLTCCVQCWLFWGDCDDDEPPR